MPINLKNKIPTTLNEAIYLIYATLDEKEKAYLTQDDALAGLHHSFGMDLRNGWGLWEKDSPIVKDVQKRFGLWGMGDDVSGLIFSGVNAQIKGLDVATELKKTAESYARHWKKDGIDPKTGKEVTGKHRQRK
jgi:hypothetical protein